MKYLQSRENVEVVEENGLSQGMEDHYSAQINQK